MDRQISELLTRYPALEPLADRLDAAARLVIETYRAGGKLLICGNGGSAADSSHIVGELMKSFRFRRPIPGRLDAVLRAAGPDGAYLADRLEGALPAVALPEAAALNSAFSNDNDAASIFAQQVIGLGRPGDLLVTLSTSGNSRNCLLAAVAARASGLRVLALTGAGGGKLAACADLLLDVPERETLRVQELHLPIYHALCAAAEAALFPAPHGAEK